MRSVVIPDEDAVGLETERPGLLQTGRHVQMISTGAYSTRFSSAASTQRRACCVTHQLQIRLQGCREVVWGPRIASTKEELRTSFC